MALQTNTGTKPDGISTFKGYMVPPHLIDFDPDFNPRDLTTEENRAHVAAIADSMRARGYDPDRPLLGRSVGERFIVTDGHCRMTALRILISEGIEIKAVPVRTEPAGTNAADRLALTLRDPGKALSAAEAASAVKRLLAFGWSEEEVAAKLGKRLAWVRSCLDLAAAPEEIKAAVKNGEIAPTEAVRIVRETNEPLVALQAARKRAAADGRDRIRTRDVQTERRSRVTPEQSAIQVFLTRWDASRRDEAAIEKAIDRLRELVP